MNKPRKHWALIADAANARIVESLGWEKGLILVETLENDIARTGEIGTDRPGRSFESANSARHAMEPRADWHRQQKETFARRIAERMAELVRTAEIDDLLVVAPPQFLGDLRRHLDGGTASKVTGELAKDLTHEPLHALAAHLKEHMPC